MHGTHSKQLTTNAEKQQNTNFIVFDLTQPGPEPTIYRTRGENANHYVTDAVIFGFDVACPPYKPS